MANAGPYTMMTCPYNPSHQVEKYRMQTHLQKCAKQHVNTKKVNCPFDATHIVNEAEIDYHVSCCSKRDMLDNMLYDTEDTYRPVVDVTPVPVVTSEENWEEDSTNSFNPEQNKKPAHVIIKPKGVAPSERRMKRMEGVKNYRPPQN